MRFTRRQGARRRPDPRRPDRSDRQRGATLVEFAFVAPVLFAVLFAVIDFGLILKDDIGVEQGVREAARQGTVAEFGSTSSCGASLPASTTVEMKKLVCLTKARSDSPEGLRVAIRFDPTDSGLSAANAYPSGTGSPPVGNGLIVCAIAPMNSTTALYGRVLDGQYVRSKVDMRIEKAVGTAQQPTQEIDPSGEGWAWCTP